MLRKTLNGFKALAHYNWNYKKIRYLSYTLQLFFTTTTLFSTVLYMDNNFPNDIFRKIFVVCKGLYDLMLRAALVTPIHFTWNTIYSKQKVAE